MCLLCVCVCLCVCVGARHIKHIFISGHQFRCPPVLWWRNCWYLIFILPSASLEPTKMLQQRNCRRNQSFSVHNRKGLTAARPAKQASCRRKLVHFNLNLRIQRNVTVLLREFCFTTSLNRYFKEYFSPHYLLLGKCEEMWGIIYCEPSVKHVCSGNAEKSIFF